MFNKRRWILPLLFIVLMISCLLGLEVFRDHKGSTRTTFSSPIKKIDKLQIDDSYLNVKDAGADTTGSTSCSQFIQEQIETGITKFFFPEGEYLFSETVHLLKKNDIYIIGDNAIVKKGNGFGEETLFSFNQCNGVHVAGIAFHGLSTSFTIGDMGIGTYSCENVTIQGNKFYYFGDAALRTTTRTASIPESTNSFNILVKDNLFENIGQTSTTPGGSFNITYENNTFNNIFSSIKFASRSKNAGHLTIINNTINNTRDGFEILNYSDVEIKNNLIKNCAEEGINIRNNNLAIVPLSMNNFVIEDNLIDTCRYGIYISNEKSEKTDYIFKDIKIIQNEIKNCGEGAIRFFGEAFNNIDVLHNHFHKTFNGIIFSVSNPDESGTNLLIEWNRFNKVQSTNIQITNDSKTPVKDVKIYSNKTNQANNYFLNLYSNYSNDKPTIVIENFEVIQNMGRIDGMFVRAKANDAIMLKNRFSSNKTEIFMNIGGENIQIADNKLLCRNGIVLYIDPRITSEIVLRNNRWIGQLNYNGVKITE